MINKEFHNLMVNRKAVFSDCEKYRYLLEIRWSEGESANFLMLNPSTADEVRNDPTVERCERRARAMGYGALLVTNLFAYRATDPREMKVQEDPVGPDNNHYILQAAKQAAIAVCAWGSHGNHQNRASQVSKMLDKAGVNLFYLKLSKTGIPWHPLYVSYNEQPKPW